MSDTLAPILPHVPAFMLVLFRMAGLFVLAPMLGSNLIPARIKVLLAVALSFCIYPLIPPQHPIDLSLAAMAPAIASEMLIGLVLGLGALLPLIAMQLGGQIMGQQLGLGLAQVLNPDFEQDSEVFSQMLFLVALLIFLLLNGHHALIGTLVGSFGRVPLGGYAPDGQTLAVLVGLLGSMFELAVRVAAPLLCLVFMEAVALGFVARTVPHVNILSMGFPLRIILGLALTAVAIGVMVYAFIGSMQEALRVLNGLFVG